jgi:hypothetical protein
LAVPRNMCIGEAAVSVLSHSVVPCDQGKTILSMHTAENSWVGTTDILWCNSELLPQQVNVSTSCATGPRLQLYHGPCNQDHEMVMSQCWQSIKKNAVAASGMTRLQIPGLASPACSFLFVHGCCCPRSAREGTDYADANTSSYHKRHQRQAPVRKTLLSCSIDVLGPHFSRHAQCAKGGVERTVNVSRCCA